MVLDAHDEQVANTADLLKSWPECEANARLIAAAPELLAAAKRLVECYANPAVDQHEDCWGVLEVAIAKTEGRS